MRSPNRSSMYAAMQRAALLAAFACNAPTFAAELLVPAQYPTIQAAINAAATGDEVVVADGIYSELVRFNGRAITVRSVNGASKTIIDGAQLGTPVKFVGSETPASVLDGFTIRNGKAAVGGGLYINSASPTVRHCVIVGNTALDRGGGAAVINGQPNFTACTFDSNLATERGGGVFLMINADATWTSCVFRSNSVRNRGGDSVGGAVAAESASDPLFSQCTFEQNVAEPADGYFGSSRGGAVWLSGPIGTFSGCTFASNAAKARQGEARGGAIYSTAALAVNASTFDGNTVRHLGGEGYSGYGGAVYSGATLTLTGCAFNSNSCADFGDGFGGATYSVGDTTSTQTTFRNCLVSTRYAYGGAIWCGAACRIDGGLLESNRATHVSSNFGSHGGAIAAPSGTVTISDATLRLNGDGPNLDTEYGGGVFCFSAITCTNVLLEGNRAHQDGGALYSSSDDIALMQCTALNNLARRSGGVAFAGGDASVLDSAVDSNLAEQGEGGAFRAGGQILAAGSSFTGNSAPNGDGGAIYTDSNAQASSTTFTSNSSRSRGGAIRCGSTGPLTDCLFSLNRCAGSNSNAHGGAIHCSSGNSGGIMTNVRFLGNAAQSATNGFEAAGGAIWGYAFEGFVNCEFRANSATGMNAYGGAIWCYGSTWQQCSFASNYASSPAATAEGGAVRIGNGYSSLGTFSGCTFTNNNADGSFTRGGAIYRFGNNLICTDTEFSGNSAREGAGAFYEWNGNDYPISFSGCRFEKNTGMSGSGIHISCVRRLDVSNCTFALNLAFNSGAAIWMNGYCMYNSQLAGNTFVGNIAESGGALYMQSCGCGWQLPISGCLFASNVATTGGGIYNAGGSGSTPAVSGTTFCGNSPADLEGYWQDNGSNIFGAGTDCNANGVCDGADIGLGTSTDCNLNGVPDECDITAGDANDINSNGLPDSCEPDCDSDGIPDAYAVKNALVPDCNSNAQPDSCDVAATTSQDDNADNVPDECQPDCDANGNPDDFDIATGAATDCNGNATPDSCDIAGAGAPDCNTNGLPDACDIATGASSDVNANSIPDDCEIDCNSNGIPDRFEIKSGAAGDCNANGVPDGCDIAGGAPDVDANGVPDSCQADCNGNSLPDSYELENGSQTDCNADGLLDACEIAAGEPDINDNGVPDSCECIGDINGDGSVGGPDLSIILGFWGPVGAFEGADITGNGTVNGEDLAILLSRWGTCR
jgi:predicted outer membrane repeat protein